MKVNGNKVKKVTLLMALLAPVIYLFGTLFEALKGSNGEINLGEPVYVTDYAESNYFDNGVSVQCDFSVRDFLTSDSPDRFRVSFPFTYLGVDYMEMVSFLYAPDGGNYLRFNPVDSSASPVYFSYVPNTGVYSGPDSVVFFSDSMLSFPLIGYDFCVFLVPTQVPSGIVSLNGGSFSEYLFSNFFAHDNFLAASGRKVIDGEPNYGFTPAADMIRFVDGNMFHLANVEYGPLVIGYSYYAFHVVCVFLIFNLLMFFPHLIENIYERFERGW